MKISLIPREEQFFDLIERVALYQVEGAALLEELVLNYVDVESKIDRINGIEHACDQVTHSTLQKLETLNKDLSEAIGDRVTKEARFYELQNAPPEGIADTLSGGAVGQLRNEVLRLERDYSEKLSVYKPEWPAMQQLQAQISKAKQNYEQVVQETVAKARENARTEYLTAKRREESLQDVLRGQKTEAMTLNANAVEYNNLRVEASTKRALMDTLLKRQSETEVMSRLGGAREGKTTTAVNLAVVLGQLGKRVLLIDGDLHKPRLHETMSVSNRVGLVSVLAEGVEASKAIQRAGVPGVNVLTSGPMSPNPSVLLASEAMAKLLAAARNSADYVVVDSPPVNLVADALILSNLADGVVLCVQGGVTPRETVLRARDALRRAGANVLGVLINAVPEEGAGYGYGSYGGYGYGSADAKRYHTDPAGTEG